MSKNKNEVACRGCGWNGAIKIWGGRFRAYNDSKIDHPDLMQRTRGTPKSWRDGYCAYCVWRRRNETVA